MKHKWEEAGKSPAGITIIELVFTVAVVGIMMAVSFARFQDVQRVRQLDAETKRLAGVFRQAQIFAYTGRLEGGVRPRSYGVHFVSDTEYFLFADTAGTGTELRYDGGDSILERYTIPSNVIVISTPSGIVGLDIVFAIPAGPIYINGVAPSPDETFTFRDSPSGTERYVIVNGVSGQVEIQ